MLQSVQAYIQSLSGFNMLSCLPYRISTSLPCMQPFLVLTSDSPDRSFRAESALVAAARWIAGDPTAS